ncbi:MAG: hypothetical protein PHZ00_04000 [Candidatus Peribacteraceae bacterium]|nr:hypothetical protein [Candidatus Peribacteraceae bacterium]
MHTLLSKIFFGLIRNFLQHGKAGSNTAVIDDHFLTKEWSMENWWGEASRGIDLEE